MTLDICLFGSELAPSRDSVYVGGAVSGAIELGRSLSNHGYNVHIVTMAPRDWESERIANYDTPDWTEGVTLIDKTAQYPGVLDGLELFYSGTNTLNTYCKNNDIDVIHGHSGYAAVATMSAVAGFLSRTPVVHTLYCPIPKDPKSIEEWLSSSFFSRLTLNRISDVCVMSRNIQKSLSDSGITRTSVVPPIIDIDAYHPELVPPRSVELTDERLSVLFVGNITPDKGVEYVIDAVEKIYGDIPVELVLTTERDFPGSEQRRGQIEMLIDQNGLRTNVTELGIIEDMPNLLAHADVLVAPWTTTEGPSDYPLVILEAMACETPVIGSSVGGIPELLADDRGYLVPPEDPEAIASALRDVHLNGTQGGQRAFIRENFARDAITEQVTEVYRRHV